MPTISDESLTLPCALVNFDMAFPPVHRSWLLNGVPLFRHIGYIELRNLSAAGTVVVLQDFMDAYPGLDAPIISASVNDGGLTINPGRNETLNNLMAYDYVFGTWTCFAENEQGNSSVDVVIRRCGE